jgi:hypothetical protein
MHRRLSIRRYTVHSTAIGRVDRAYVDVDVVVDVDGAVDVRATVVAPG